MTLCPIAIAASCRKCPVFRICPLKGVIGDYVKEEDRKKKKGEKTRARAKRRG